MGKTYRRTDKGRKKKYLPRMKWKLDEQLRQKHGVRTWSDRWKRPEVWEAYEREVDFLEGYYGNDPNSPWYKEYFHWMTTPSWWIREMMTKPKRAQCRALVQKLKKGDVDPDEVLFPHARKPHIYYW